MNLLFICSKNRLRSPTAEAVFSAYDGIAAIGAGVNPDSPTPLTGDLVEWADLIFVMESSHRRRVNARFGKMLRGKEPIVLGIPDNYSLMEPALVEILARKVEPLIGAR